jgi:hypothetical protein
MERGQRSSATTFKEYAVIGIENRSNRAIIRVRAAPKVWRD